MNFSLYEISERFIAVLDMATDPEADVPADAALDTLDALEGEFHEKAIAVAGYFQNIEAHVEAMKDAERRISMRRRQAEAASARLREYLKIKMEWTGISKIECPSYSITLAKCPPSVEITDEALIPERFINVKIIQTPDKTAIKAAGGCPGTVIVTDKKTLRIR